MLNTLNYSEAIDAFSSFLSCTPKWYIPINGGFYSFNSDNKCFLHNSGDAYNYLDMSGEERRSVIRLLVNDDYETTKTFDNVSYSGDFEDGENLIPFKFKTRLHTTNQVDDVYNREDTYKFSIPRDSSETSLGERVLFPARLRGKYMVCDYVFKSSDGNRFRLPYIETTYRYSMI